MRDYLVKATAYEGTVRAYALDATEMVNEAVRRQDTWPTASAALGRAMMATTLMGSMLKGNAKLTTKIEGGGPIGAIVTDANAKGEARGYVTNPHVHFELNQNGKLDVARAVGRNGSLSVVKDIGMKEPFTGSVPIVSGELGEDFTYYFVTSEQTPSSVGVGVLVNPDQTILAAGGFVIQLMPGASDEVITEIEDRLGRIAPISKMIEEGRSPEQIITTILREDQVKFLERMSVRFACTCSKERIANAIVSLGQKEIRSMIEEDGQAETKCHFCNEVYYFSSDDLEGLYRESS